MMANTWQIGYRKIGAMWLYILFDIMMKGEGIMREEKKFIYSKVLK